MEQLSFDMEISDERRAFELVYPGLADLIYNAPMESEVIGFSELNDYSSVYLLTPSKVLFRIRSRKKSRYLSIAKQYVESLPEGTVVKHTQSDPGMVRIPFSEPEDILNYMPALRAILDQEMRKCSSFGCCGMYEACSDEKKCIHPNLKFALGCIYRRNLMDGKIFYGKNRNV